MTREEKEKFLDKMYYLGLSTSQGVAELCSEEKKLVRRSSILAKILDIVKWN